MSMWGSDRRKKAQGSAVSSIAIILSLILLILVGRDPTVEAAKKINDQTKLARIAVEAKDANDRRAAVEKLSDQGLLAYVALEAKDEGVRRTAVEKLTDQMLLARVVLEEKAWAIRRSAVVKLADQALLAKVAVEDESESVRRAAAEKLTDQAVLARMGMWIKPELTRQVTDQDLLGKITLEAKEESVRRAAAEKLTDQAVLTKVAMEDKAWDVRRAAVEKLTDQTVLAKIAVNENHREVRRAAVEKLTDQTVLAKVAIEDKYPDVRRAAVEKLTDQMVLAKIAVEEKELDIRVAAIGKVTDQALLRRWSEKDPQAAIRQAAVMRVADDGFLVQRLPMESSAAVRETIVATLHKKESLRAIAQTAYHRNDREQALRRLQKSFHDPASDVEAAHEALTQRVKALAAETDSSKLLALTLTGEFDVLRTVATRHLSDPVALEQAALRVNNRDVLKILLAKLEDKAMLNRIAGAANDRPMRLAAARKAGAESWTEIFAAATAKDATVQMLGNAIAAVSLFPEVQPDAVQGVQHAALNLIRRGDESRIPEMVDLLEGYGDKTLAEDYLNCGQPDLDTVGRAWARNRGYAVGAGAGSHRARWGSDR